MSRNSSMSSRWRPGQWAIAQLPVKVAFPVTVVIATATMLVLAAMFAAPWGAVEAWQHLAILCLLGLVHSEITYEIEKIRARIAGDVYVDLTSTWIFAGAVLLPFAHASILAVVLVAHLQWRSARARTPMYRRAFSIATVVLGCLAAGATMTMLGFDPGSPGRNGAGVAVLVVGALVTLTVNTALVAGAIAVSAASPKLDEILGGWSENLLEIATLCLGGLAAVAIVINPWLVLFVLPPLLVLHRAVLVRHLEDAASTDGKTGLLNAAAWHAQAERELRRVGRRVGPRAVLVLDLDHFKKVNDTHGHLAGDHVLAAVADGLRDEVRDRDLVGRFGGEEFVVLLAGLGGPGLGAEELDAVAERIRRRVAGLRVEIATPDGPLTIAGLSVSVGGALHPRDGAELQELLQVADAALYAAKRGGRNRVHTGLTGPDMASAEEHPDRS